jgi:hypothetical protein
VRDYTPLAHAPRAAFDELQKIGAALGAHGFVTISSIEGCDGQRYYFEADMRPNVWVDFSAYFGHDLAARIRKWFDKKEGLAREEVGVAEPASAPVRLPYFLRLRGRELMTNRYDVWNFIPLEDRALVLRLLFRKLFMLHLMRFGRLFVPRKWRPGVKLTLAKFGMY